MEISLRGIINLSSPRLSKVEGIQSRGGLSLGAGKCFRKGGLMGLGSIVMMGLIHHLL